MIIRLLVILALSWTMPCFALDITFMQSSSVDSDIVLLSDIASLSEQSPLSQALGSQIVGTAPNPGLEMVLDAREIIKKIEKSKNSTLNGVVWRGSSLILLTRKSVTINPEKIQEIIDDYLAEHSHRLPDAEISFTPNSLPLPFQIHSGSLSWEVIPSSPQVIGSSRFSLILKVDNKVRKNFSIRGHTKAIAPAVVTTRKLKYGEILTAEMVSIAKRDISKEQSYSKTVAEVLGSVVKRNIKQGSVIGPAFIERPPVIKKGERVKIFVNHRGLVLTATGIAKSNGRIDDVIRVKNSNSNKLIHCRVQAPGLVEVRL